VPKGFCVRSAEQNQCPCCSGGLKVIGSCRRKFVNSAGDTVILNFVGYKVDVIYDPADTSELTIEYEDHAFKAKQLVIGSRAGARPHLPEHLLPERAESSRLLTGAAKKNRERHEQQKPAVSYRTIRKGGGGGV